MNNFKNVLITTLGLPLNEAGFAIFILFLFGKDIPFGIRPIVGFVLMIIGAFLIIIGLWKKG